MVQINFGLKEISAKIVYYGPGMSGKTTNLEKVHELAPKERTGNMTTIATEGDRTLFFDFMPLDLGTVAGMKTKLQLYTVPGQIYYDATRKLVLQGADGVIFVADSSAKKMPENIESLDNLEKNLRENNIDINTIPLIIQYNKRDLPDALSIEDMDKSLKRYTGGNAEYTTASAYVGEGVMASLKALSKLVLADLNNRYGGKAGAPGAPAAQAPAAAPQAQTSVPPPIAPPAAPAAPAVPKPAAVAPPAAPSVPAVQKPVSPPPAVKPAASAPSAPAASAKPAQPAVESNIKTVEKKKGFFSRLFGK